MAETIWIARHGSRLDFVDPDWHKGAVRPYDPPLSPEGLHQAQQVGRRLKAENVAHIFSSPFLRCIQTASMVAGQLKLPVKVESGFSEWLNPDWFPSKPEVLPEEELLRQFPAIDPGYRSRVPAVFPESGEEVLKRTGKAIQIVADGFGGVSLVVGHGATVYGSLVELGGKSFDEASRLLGNVHYCCLSKLVRDGDRWAIECAGDVSHLQKAEGGDRFH